MARSVQPSSLSRDLGAARALLVRQPLAGQKLRISLTASCNYSCFFCHNEGALPQSAAKDLLSPDDVALIASAAVDSGFTSIKLTGGEPLVYRHGSHGVLEVIERVANRVGDSADLSMTTNGQLLAKYADGLARAGLDRLTVSIHTLDTATFKRDISAGGSPAAQLRGIEAALRTGLGVKANVLVLAENAHEVPDLVETLHGAGVREVRFYRLLWTPLLGDRFSRSRVPDREILDLASSALGVGPSSDELDWAESVLDGTLSSDEFRSLAISYDGRRILLDAMARPLGAWDGSEEGDYAVRIGAYGELRTRLFEPEEDLSPLLGDRTGAALRRRLHEAQRSLNL